jgi:hypothetical protein
MTTTLITELPTPEDKTITTTFTADPTTARTARDLGHYPFARIQEALELHKCDHCGAETGFMDSFHVTCPDCTARFALHDAAQDQLERLLSPVVRAWATHWGAIFTTTGVETHVSGVLESFHGQFERFTASALEGLE